MKQPDYYAANPSFRKADVAAAVSRDFSEVAGQLSQIVSEHLANGSEVAIRDLKTPVGAGSSNETILFHADWNGKQGAVSRGLVLRIGPSKFQMFMDPRMKDQYRLMQTFHKTGRVKVAEPLLFVEDKALFGASYMLMGRLVGNVPVSFPPYNAEGFLVDATVAQRRKAWEGALHQLTQLATTPIEDVAFLAETDGDGSFDAQFDWWRRASKWSGVDHYPDIAEMERWLIDNQPKDPPPGLSWGDARMGNIMFAPDFSVAAVLDWEQVALGGALLDLGWWLYFDRFQSETLGLKRLEGLGSREETIARFQQETGIEVRDLFWYEMFAGWKTAVLTARKLVLEKVSAPSNNGNNNIITQANAKLRGLPAPADVIETY